MAPPDPRIKQACDAMKEKLDIPERKVRTALRRLRKVYGNGWSFIEDDNYKVLIDEIIGQDAEQNKEGKKKESNDGAMSRGKKRALEQKPQLLLKHKEEDDSDEEDEFPLKKRSRRKRESGCDNNNNISLSLGSSSSSKNPNIEDVKEQTDVVELVSLGCTTSKKPNEEEHQHTLLAVKDEDKVINEDERETECDNNAGLTLRSTSKKPTTEDHEHTQLALKENIIDGDQRQRGCENITSLTLGSTSSNKPNEEDLKPEEEDEVTELPPLKRYLRRTNGERVSTSPVMFLPADPVVAEKESVSSALTIINNATLTDHKPLIPENGSAHVQVEAEKESVLSALTIVNNDLSTDQKPMIPGAENSAAHVLVIDTTAMDVPPPSEKVSDMVVKAGDTSCEADTSMGLVVAPESEISADGWRALSNKKDITLGAENIKIPWVNEINDEVPPRFHYMTHNYASQNADVKFTVSSIHGCFLCIGDCLASSTPCSCTIPYTSEGVLKKDFLEARISEARDPRKLVFQECRGCECPLEARMEPCKGHVKREAIKECWMKCGCSMSCANRVVQRGIHSKLEVFYTSDGRGWGLRTLESLPQGSFVCEYVGEILTVSELCQREVSSPVILDAFWGCSEEGLDDSKSLCLDGTLCGNVSRFINHKCIDPNLVEIPVHVETPDQHYYHLAFFTTRDIKAMEELTWDYGVDFEDEDGVMKPFDCVCGYRLCRNPKRSKKAKRVMKRA